MPSWMVLKWLSTSSCEKQYKGHDTGSERKLLHSRAMLRNWYNKLLLGRHKTRSCVFIIAYDLLVHTLIVPLCHVDYLAALLILAPDSFLDWTAHRARLLLALAVVREHIASSHSEVWSSSDPYNS